jgi:hypothetical protein
MTSRHDAGKVVYFQAALSWCNSNTAIALHIEMIAYWSSLKCWPLLFSTVWMPASNSALCKSRRLMNPLFAPKGYQIVANTQRQE